MEPLDLTKHAPRGPREKLAGCAFMARTIDKVRAELPGGNLGKYVVEGQHSLSAYVLHKLRIPVDELRAEVARAKDESEIEAWLRARVDPAVVEEVNRKLGASRTDNLTPEGSEFLYSRHPLMRGREAPGTTFDFLEADDAAEFSAAP